MGTQNKFELNRFWNLLMILAIAASMAACSSSSTSDEDDLEDEDESAELAEAGTDEVPEDSLEDLGDDEDLPEGENLAENDESELDEPEIPEALEDEGMASVEEPVAPEEESMETAANEAEEMSQPAINEFQSESSNSFSGSGNYESYTVRNGDTLMKVAFEYYGDLNQWKQIFEANRDRISDPNMIPAGTVLKIESPASPVAIERNGERYQIKQGDTLGTISAEVYGNSGKWRKLWRNNRQLIKDPNKIYAGFDLYYLPEAGTEAPQMAAPESFPDADPAQEEIQAVVDEANVDPGVQPEMRVPASN